VQRGLKRGEVPEDADLATWSATVDEHRRQLRRSLWFGPVVFGAMVVLAIWLALTSTPWCWFGVAFFVGFLLFSVITTPRALAKAEVVREELRRRANGL
jgi:Zn-dependent membrane protease YugP